ncbi:HNH endonuclease [Paenibacillus terrigena]|uniref:HNH endonuclease n=1 Tax=Paenibacillus terrigena TaxID=369333 RepID=UPI0028D7D4D3|nr:HNH endonuclease [Paenibacillus terrigena]
MTLPSKSKIFEHWMDWYDRKGYDWGEPCCWACGKHWEDKYDIKKSGATRGEIIKNWDRVPLQRCHIVARQFGGSDEPANLFLMCSDCHDKAPNTKSVEAFLMWTEKQNWLVNFKEEIMKEINTYGLKIE